MEQKSLIVGGRASDILLKLKIPKKTASYSPLPYRQVMDLTMDALAKANMNILKTEYTAARNGKQGIGIYTIGNSSDKEMGIRIAWQNSYDKSLALKWACGANIFICSNGMFRGDDTFGGLFKRKHTGECLEDYKEHVKIYVNEAGEMFEKLVFDRERMKEIEITKRTCAELVGRMFIEQSIITSTQLNIIKREIENPSFDYGKASKGKVWELYNHTTLALKEAHPELYMSQHTDVHKFFANEFALK